MDRISNTKITRAFSGKSTMLLRCKCMSKAIISPVLSHVSVTKRLFHHLVEADWLLPFTHDPKIPHFSQWILTILTNWRPCPSRITLSVWTRSCFGITMWATFTVTLPSAVQSPFCTGTCFGAFFSLKRPRSSSNSILKFCLVFGDWF